MIPVEWKFADGVDPDQPMTLGPRLYRRRNREHQREDGFPEKAKAITLEPNRRSYRPQLLYELGWGNLKCT
jgi:hypothetical protein